VLDGKIMDLKNTDTIKDILERNMGKKLELLLKNGKIYTCIIHNIGQFCVHVELLGERSFFDAIIRIDDISTIEFQVRKS